MGGQCPEAYGQGNGLRWREEACVWSVSAAEYRRLQDEAYINKLGSGGPLYGLMLVYPLASIAQSSYAGLVQHLASKSALLAALVDACCLLPLAAAFTTASLTLPLLLYAPLLLEALRRLRRRDWIREAFCVDEGRLRFVTEYRAMVMVSTCIVILAVDFASLFPRHHAKTEEFGYALMDLGTGCIIFASAVSGSRRPHGEKRGFFVKLWPVMLLGGTRAAFLWGIDYHVHVSEYGVHWNFFFTIAVVALVSTTLELQKTALQSAVAGLAAAIAYQIFLSAGGGEYLLYAPRVGLFSANREGILSSAGYLSLHWLGVSVGCLLRNSPSGRVVLQLLALSALSGVATFIMSTAGLEVSRRMCNLPYILYTFSINTWVLALLGLVDLVSVLPRPPISLTLAGVSESLLVVFLLANLLTGAINLALQPLLLPRTPAMLVMATYCVSWSAPVAFLHAKSFRLKFW